MKHLIVILSVFVFGVSCKKDSDKKSAQGSQISAEYLPMRWSDASLASPINLRISKDFIDQATTPEEGVETVLAIQKMMKVWDDQLKSKNMFVYHHDVENTVVNENRLLTAASLYGPKDDLDSYDDQTLGIYRIDPWFPGRDLAGGVLAVTQFFVSRTNVGQDNEYLRLVHADIIMNFEEFDFRLDNFESGDHSFNFQTVVLHELGHFLGLGHSGEYGSVMFPYLDKMSDYLELEADDKKEIKDLYGFSTKSASMQASAIADPELLKEEGKRYRGIIELRASGECVHYLDGVRVHSHPVNTKALKKSPDLSLFKR